MQKFQIEIEEILQRVEEVEANDLEEALEKTEEKYDQEKIVLDYNDFKGYEIREYVDGVKDHKLEKDEIFDINYGKAILLEGNNKLALIKKIGVEDYPYVVVSGLTVNKNNTYFEWNQGSYFQTLIEATEKFAELGGYEKEQNVLISKVEEKTLENKIFDSVKEYDEMLNKSQEKWEELQKLKPDDMDKLDFQNLIQQARLDRKLSKEYVKMQDEKYKYIVKCSLKTSRDKFENQYLLVKNTNEFDTELEVDITGGFAFNCDFEVINPKIVKVLNSLEELQEFCKQKDIDIPKDRLSKQGLIVGGSVKTGFLIDKDLNAVGWIEDIEKEEREI